MHSVIFEHLKEHKTLTKRIFEDARKQLEKFSPSFLSYNHLNPGHLQPKTLGPYFFGFPRQHKSMFSLFRDAKNLCDRAHLTTSFQAGVLSRPLSLSVMPFS